MAMDGSNAEEWATGCSLSIKTTLGDEFQGQVITFDRPSNILVLQEGSKPGSRRNIRLLKANYIKEFTYLGQGEDPLDPKKCFLDLNSLRAKEELAIRQAETEAERIGVGVTNEAQSIFDALFKTLPVRWDKTSIVVMNEIRVCSPYLPESVTGGTPAANDRVKKVRKMGNCQAVEGAALVIQHPSGKVERFYWPLNASEVMRLNPGHYVSLIIPLQNSQDPKTVRVKLLRPNQTLSLGHAYRLVATQEVMKVLKAKKYAKTKKQEMEMETIDKSQRAKEKEISCSCETEDKSDKTVNRVCFSKPMLSLILGGKNERHRALRMTWRPSLQSISESGS